MEETKRWSNRLHAFMNKILNRVIYIIFEKIVRYFMGGVNGVCWGEERRWEERWKGELWLECKIKLKK